MSKFQVVRKLDLAYLGEGWEGAYINLSALTFKDGMELQALEVKGDENTPDAAKSGITMVKSHFISGKGFDGNALVDLTADDLEDLPVDVLTKCISTLSSSPSPN